MSGQFNKEMSKKSFQEVKKSILQKEPLVQYQFSIKLKVRSSGSDLAIRVPRSHFSRNK